MENNKLTIRNLNPRRFYNSITSSSISDILDEMLSEFSHTSDKFSEPSINVKETDTLHQIQLSAPGYKKENFKIDIDENLLTISNEFKEEKSEENETWTRKEFKRSSFYRSFFLPRNLNTDEISAKYEDGILYIDVPKIEKKIKSKTIDIK